MEPRELSMTIDGEGPGHPFRGNQYTKGMSAAELHVMEVAHTQMSAMNYSTSMLFPITKNINGSLSDLAAEYDSLSGRVNVDAHGISLAGYSDKQIKFVVAHEVGHAIFTANVAHGGAALEVLGRPLEMAKSGAITPYAKDFWDEYHRNPTSKNWMDAAHETFAEAIAFRHTDPDVYKKTVPAEWRKVVDAFEHRWKQNGNTSWAWNSSFTHDQSITEEHDNA